MTTLTIFFILIPSLAAILLGVTLILAPHEPYKEKETPFECGYHSFIQTRVEVNVIHFVIGLLFLIFDLEVVLVFPFSQSIEFNGIYGLTTVVLFLVVLGLGFIFEIGKNALKFITKLIPINTNENKPVELDKPMMSSILPSANYLKAYLVTFISVGLFLHIFNITLGLKLGFLIAIISIVMSRVIISFLDGKQISWNLIFIIIGLFVYIYIIKWAFLDLGICLYQHLFEDDKGESDKYIVPISTIIAYLFSDLLAEKYFIGPNDIIGDKIFHEYDRTRLYTMSDDDNSSSDEGPGFRASPTRDLTMAEESSDDSDHQMEDDDRNDVLNDAELIPSQMRSTYLSVARGMDIVLEDEPETSNPDDVPGLEPSMPVNYNEERIIAAETEVGYSDAGGKIEHIEKALEHAEVFQEESKEALNSIKDAHSNMRDGEQKDRLKARIDEATSDLNALESDINSLKEKYNNAIIKKDEND